MDKDYNTTVREASELLGVSISSVRRYIRQGLLTKVYEQGKHGKTIMLCRDEVDQLAKERSQGAMDSDQMIKLGRYEELKERYNKLESKYETLVFRSGAIETRYKELEAEAESLRIQAKKGLFERIKNFFQIRG